MPVADVPPHPVVRSLCPQAHVLHGRMGLRNDVHRVPVLPQASTIFLAKCVLPVPGKPVSSRLSPSRQWTTGSSTRRHLGFGRIGSATMQGSRHWPFSPVTSS